MGTSYTAEVVARKFQSISSDKGCGSFKIVDRYKEELRHFIDDLSKLRNSVSNCRIAYS